MRAQNGELLYDSRVAHAVTGRMDEHLPKLGQAFCQLVSFSIQLVEVAVRSVLLLLKLSIVLFQLFAILQESFVLSIQLLVIMQ